MTEEDKLETGIDYESIFGSWHYLGNEIELDKWLQADLTEKMKRTFHEYFLSSRILCKYELHDSELLVIEAMVRMFTRKQSEFAGIIQRAIPYPVVLIQNYQNEWYKISTADKHENTLLPFREVVDRQNTTRIIQKWPCEMALKSIADICFVELTREKAIDRIKDELSFVNSNLAGLSFSPSDLPLCADEIALERLKILTQAQGRTVYALKEIVGELLQVLNKLHNISLIESELSEEDKENDIEELRNLIEDLSQLFDEMDFENELAIETYESDLDYSYFEEKAALPELLREDLYRQFVYYSDLLIHTCSPMYRELSNRRIPEHSWESKLKEALGIISLVDHW